MYARSESCEQKHVVDIWIRQCRATQDAGHGERAFRQHIHQLAHLFRLRSAGFYREVHWSPGKVIMSWPDHVDCVCTPHPQTSTCLCPLRWCCRQQYACLWSLYAYKTLRSRVWTAVDVGLLGLSSSIIKGAVFFRATGMWKATARRFELLIPSQPNCRS